MQHLPGARFLFAQKGGINIALNLTNMMEVYAVAAIFSLSNFVTRSSAVRMFSTEFA
jgi:hypothetical protein